MLRKTLVALTLSAFVGIVGFEAMPNAEAAVVTKKVVVKKNGHVTKKRTVWVYNARTHGPRYRYRTGAYTYYYGGYYYSRPWWTIGVAGGNLCIGC